MTCWRYAWIHHWELIVLVKVYYDAKLGFKKPNMGIYSSLLKGYSIFSFFYVNQWGFFLIPRSSLWFFMAHLILTKHLFLLLMSSFISFPCYQLRDEELSKESQESNWFSAPSALRVYGEKTSVHICTAREYISICGMCLCKQSVRLLLTSVFFLTMQASTWTWIRTTMACWAKRSFHVTARPLSPPSFWTECFRSASHMRVKWYGPQH